MSPLVRRSILKKFLIVVSCTLPVCVPTTLALAQHPTARTAGGAVHISAPPISHVPISSTPMIHAPIIYAPTSTPRISVARLRAHSARLVFALLGVRFAHFRRCWSFTNLPFFLADNSGNGTPIGGQRVTSSRLGRRKTGRGAALLERWHDSQRDRLLACRHQLHFTTIEEDGTKAEHLIPFEALDLQTTVDANTRRGFRFMLRNEPFEQYVCDHPEGPAPVATPPHE
jgi:hypothetical protein